MPVSYLEYTIYSTYIFIQKRPETSSGLSVKTPVYRSWIFAAFTIASTPSINHTVIYQNLKIL